MPTTANLRKAAILIRTLDADTAAGLLAQLTPAEAKEVRMAIQALGEVDDDERADVSAEFRRSGAVATEDPTRGVELEFSSTTAAVTNIETSYETRPAARPFEFLEHARVESLVPYLSREHAQTVAVVLSYLAPSRAAQVLAALPDKLQADAIERLSVLGSTDPDTLQVLERELADWVTRQQATRTRPTQRTETVAVILAAADQQARGEILANLLKHNRGLADQLAPKPVTKVEPVAQPEPTPVPIADCGLQIADAQPIQSAIPRLHIDDLARFDPAALAAVLQSVDAEVLTLALVGASDSLVERITDQMPRKVAKAFRQRLYCVGPTRLRDVETAQYEVTTVAAHILHHRRTNRRAIVA